MTSSSGKQLITIHILHNISRSKGKQKIKNVFLEKSLTRWVGETSPRPFSKKSKLTITLNQKSQILIGFFIVYVQDKDRTTKIY